VRAQIINIASFLNKITTFVSPKVVPLYICSCGKVLKLKFWFEKGIALESVQEPKEILMLFLIGAFLQLQQNIFVRNFFHLSSLKKNSITFQRLILTVPVSKCIKNVVFVDSIAENNKKWLNLLENIFYDFFIRTLFLFLLPRDRII
jgi:hypothetical protein